jgi:hypothetical protein
MKLFQELDKFYFIDIDYGLCNENAIIDLLDAQGLSI